jgi:hypothetical protein
MCHSADALSLRWFEKSGPFAGHASVVKNAFPEQKVNVQIVLDRKN